MGKMINNGHRVIVMMILCLFGLCIIGSVAKTRRTRAGQKKEDTRVYLRHSDELQYDMYRMPPNAKFPNAQIARGKVQFFHKGATLTCDSAYFYEERNAFEAFGHVHMKQGDTLNLVSEYAWYDGDDEMAYARRNVVLTHRKSKLYCDSLNFDRMYGVGYFYDGGKLVDNGNTLTSDWGQYNTEDKMAKFVYRVKLRNKDMRMDTDTLYYDTKTSLAHAVGPSVMITDSNKVNTNDGFYNTKTKRSELYGRSTVYNGKKTIIADSLYSNETTTVREGYGNVIYEDPVNKNIFKGDYLWYEENTGKGLAHTNALVMDYSQGPDTLYVHGDTIRMETININTDSVFRKVHAYPHVRAFRNDIQAICDSLTMSTFDSCMTMYKDPIVWNLGRQVLGEVIHTYANDSTIRYADVIGQALSVEMVDSTRFNQISAKEMRAYFNDGTPRQTWAIGNVETIYYPIDDSDSTIIGLNALTTDTLKMFLTQERTMEKIWTAGGKGTLYPITQIPPEKLLLPNFAWFEHIRPVSKDDIFVWRGKDEEHLLKPEKARDAKKTRSLGK